MPHALRENRMEGCMPTPPVYVYLDRAPDSLLERWLHGYSTDADVTVLTLAPVREYAEALRARYPSHITVVPYDPARPQDPVTPRLSIPDQAEVVLTLPTRVQPLRFHFPYTMPEIQPHYAVVRQLHRLGFRRFRWLSYSGENHFHIPTLLDDWVNTHRGRRCFVVGNGPSLAALDMRALKDEITFGCNRVYLGYPHWGFSFTYWGIYDAVQIERYGVEYLRNCPPHNAAFFPFHYLPLFPRSEGCPVPIEWHPTQAHGFSDSPERLYVGFTVIHMLLQIAAIMGCDPIILIGVDHRYPLSMRVRSGAWQRLRRILMRRLRGTLPYELGQTLWWTWMQHYPERYWAKMPRVWKHGDVQAPTHFHDAYTKEEGRIFSPPDLTESERGYEVAQRWAQQHGRTILNATPNSALTVFPRVAFERLFDPS
jgi:hypothetical protein